MRLKRCWNVQDFRLVAKKRLPKIAFDFVDTGVLDESTKNANVRAWSDIYKLQPKALGDTDGVDTTVEIFGVKVDAPLLVAPMGSLTLLHNSSDIGLAKAASKADSIFMHSFVSSVSIEETVEHIAPDRVWAQTLIRADPKETLSYLERLTRLGIKTIVVNAETRFADNRERDLRNGLWSMPPKPPLSGLISILLRPDFLFRLFLGRRLTRGDYSINGRKVRMSEIYKYFDWSTTISWSDIEEVRSNWNGNLVVKGIMNASDAERVANLGANGILVSNLGGRHFDAGPATLEMLPSIISAVKTTGANCDVFIDGGVRRGRDAVIALALGAKAVSAGRPFAYALAAFGEKGVNRLYGLLKTEFYRAMVNVGAKRPSEISPACLIADNKVSPRA